MLGPTASAVGPFLSADGSGERLQNLTVRLSLDEGNHAHVSHDPLTVDMKFCHGDFGRRVVDRVRTGELSDDEVVVKREPRILTRFNLIPESVFGERKEQHSIRLFLSKRYRCRDVDVPIAQLRQCQCDVCCRGSVRRRRDFAVGARRMPAAKVCAVQQDLWCVDRTRSPQARVAVLPMCEFDGGIRILPAELVPVIDMKGKGRHCRPVARRSADF